MPVGSETDNRPEAGPDAAAQARMRLDLAAVFGLADRSRRGASGVIAQQRPARELQHPGPLPRFKG
jgi:hypothetical protein